MRRFPVLLVMVASAALLRAQTVPGIILIPPQQCVWRAGDNPAWAAPSLDESGWQPYTQWTLQPGDAHMWVRCHAGLSSLRGAANPAIQVSLHAAYRLYVNGQLVGGAGNLRSGQFSMDTIRSFPLSRSFATQAAIALRVTYLLASPAPGQPLPPLDLHAGDESALRGRRAVVILAQSQNYLSISICYGIVCVFGIVLLGLFLHDRSRREVLLLCIVCYSLAGIYLSYVPYLLMANCSSEISLAVWTVALLSVEARIWFPFVLVRRRVPLLFWILIAPSCIFVTLSGVDAFLPPAEALRLGIILAQPFTRAAFLPQMLAETAPFVAFWPYSRIPPRMRPLAACCMIWGATMVFFIGTVSTPTFMVRWNTLGAEAQAIATLAVIAALLGLLFRDQQQVAQERALLAGEVQAARSVQQYLIPEHLPATPGFAIESEYRPARQVGGDFYQVLPQPADGSLLIVIGDVAGKGVEAGMLATLIVGAVRTAAAFTSDPEHILALLNERLQGRGLVTCLALHIDRDGSATLVNAGHLPPYLNGKEIVVEGSLPLGAAPGIPFPVARFQLAESDTLLLMTDGVVEAQNAQGQLFGFERIGDLLRKGVSAAEVANAAQRWGQEDDITVLTLTFAPAEVLHA